MTLTGHSFRPLATSGSAASGSSGLGLPLTKALAEANRASFYIKSAPKAGTLVEIAFPPSQVRAKDEVRDARVDPNDRRHRSSQFRAHFASRSFRSVPWSTVTGSRRPAAISTRSKDISATRMGPILLRVRCVDRSHVWPLS